MAASVPTYADDDGVGDDVDTPTVLTTYVSEPKPAKVVDLDTIYDPPLASKKIALNSISGSSSMSKHKKQQQ